MCPILANDHKDRFCYRLWSDTCKLQLRAPSLINYSEDKDYDVMILPVSHVTMYLMFIFLSDHFNVNKNDYEFHVTPSVC